MHGQPSKQLQSQPACQFTTELNPNEPPRGHSVTGSYRTTYNTVKNSSEMHPIPTANPLHTVCTRPPAMTAAAPAAASEKSRVLLLGSGVRWGDRAMGAVRWGRGWGEEPLEVARVPHDSSLLETRFNKTKQHRRDFVFKKSSHLLRMLPHILQNWRKMVESHEHNSTVDLLK